MIKERPQPTPQKYEQLQENIMKKLYGNKLGNLKEMDNFLETYKLPKLKQEEIENLNRLITSKEIESVLKNLPTSKTSGSDGFPGEFYQTFKEEIIPVLLSFQKIKMERKLQNSFYKASITLIPKPDNDPTKKENYRPAYPMNLGAKMLDNILANQIQQYTKRIIDHNQWDLFLGCKCGSIFIN